MKSEYLVDKRIPRWPASLFFRGNYFITLENRGTETAGAKTLSALIRWLYAQGDITCEMLTGKRHRDEKELTVRRLLSLPAS